MGTALRSLLPIASTTKNRSSPQKSKSNVATLQSIGHAHSAPQFCPTPPRCVLSKLCFSKLFPSAPCYTPQSRIHCSAAAAWLGDSAPIAFEYRRQPCRSAASTVAVGRCLHYVRRNVWYNRAELDCYISAWLRYNCIDYRPSCISGSAPAG